MIKDNPYLDFDKNPYIQDYLAEQGGGSTKNIDIASFEGNPFDAARNNLNNLHQSMATTSHAGHYNKALTEPFRYQNRYNPSGFDARNYHQNYESYTIGDTWGKTFEKSFDDFGHKFKSAFVEGIYSTGRLLRAGLTLGAYGLNASEDDLLRKYTEDQKNELKNAIFLSPEDEEKFFNKKFVKDFVGNSGFAFGTIAEIGLEALLTFGVGAIGTQVVKAGAKGIANLAARTALGSVDDIARMAVREGAEASIDDVARAAAPTPNRLGLPASSQRGLGASTQRQLGPNSQKLLGAQRQLPPAMTPPKTGMRALPQTTEKGLVTTQRGLAVRGSTTPAAQRGLVKSQAGVPARTATERGLMTVEDVAGASEAAAKASALKNGASGASSAGRNSVKEAFRVSNDFLRNKAFAKDYYKKILGYAEDYIPVFGNLIKTGRGVRAAVKGGAAAEDVFKIGFDGFRRSMLELSMASSEATLESVSAYGDMFTSLQQDFVRKHNRAPTPEEMQKIYNTAMESAGDVYNLNLGILLAMNKIQFGGIMQKWAPNNKMMREFLGEESIGALKTHTVSGTLKNEAATKATRIYRKGSFGTLGIAGKIAKDFGKRKAAWEATKSLGRNMLRFEGSEGIQELLQEGGSHAVGEYHHAVYDGGSMSLGEMIDSGIGSQWNQQGVKTFLIGAFTGRGIAATMAVANPIVERVSRMAKGEQEQYVEYLKQFDDDVRQVNDFLATPNEAIADNIQSLQEAMSSAEKMTIASGSQNVYRFNNAKEDLLFNTVKAARRVGATDAIYDALDNVAEDYTATEFKEAFGVDIADTNFNSPREFVRSIRDDIKKYVETYDQLEQEVLAKMNPMMYAEGTERTRAKIIKGSLRNMIDTLAINAVKEGMSIERFQQLQQELALDPEIGSSSEYVLRTLSDLSVLQSELGNMEKELNDLAEFNDADSNARKELLKKKIGQLKIWGSLWKDGKFIGKLNPNHKLFSEELVEDWFTDEQIDEAMYDQEIFDFIEDMLNTLNSETGNNRPISKRSIEQNARKIIDYVRLSQDAKSYAQAVDAFYDPEKFVKLQGAFFDGSFRFRLNHYLQRLGGGAVGEEFLLRSALKIHEKENVPLHTAVRLAGERLQENAEYKELLDIYTSEAGFEMSDRVDELFEKIVNDFVGVKEEEKTEQAEDAEDPSKEDPDAPKEPDSPQPGDVEKEVNDDKSDDPVVNDDNKPDSEPPSGGADTISPGNKMSANQANAIIIPVDDAAEDDAAGDYKDHPYDDPENEYYELYSVARDLYGARQVSFQELSFLKGGGDTLGAEKVQAEIDEINEKLARNRQKWFDKLVQDGPEVKPETTVDNDGGSRETPTPTQSDSEFQITNFAYKEADVVFEIRHGEAKIQMTIEQSGKVTAFDFSNNKKLSEKEVDDIYQNVTTDRLKDAITAWQNARTGNYTEVGTEAFTQYMNASMELSEAISEVLVEEPTAPVEPVETKEPEVETPVTKEKEKTIEESVEENLSPKTKKKEEVVEPEVTVEPAAEEIETTEPEVLTDAQKNNLEKAKKGEKAEAAAVKFDSLEDLLKYSKSLLGKSFDVNGVKVEFVDYKGEVLTGAGQRVFVKVNINGIPVTFYSSTGSGKKALQEGVFYPTLGIESDARYNGTWINKVNGVEMASYYNSPTLAAVGAFIDSQFGNVNSFAGNINEKTRELDNPNKEALTKERALEIRKEYNKEYLNNGRETFSNTDGDKVRDAFKKLVEEIESSRQAKTEQTQIDFNKNVNAEETASGNTSEIDDLMSGLNNIKRDDYEAMC